MVRFEKLKPGTQIGGHTIGRYLASGGFGVTYQARNNKTGDVVAIKEYFPQKYAKRQANGTVTAQPDGQQVFDVGLETFLTEANLLKTLPRQQNLVRVRGAFSRSGTAYCLMEFIEGDPLNEILPRMVREYGAVPESLIREFVVSMATALSAVHKIQLLHRDIKPANMMIRRRDQQPVLIDFGAAKQFGETTDSMTMITRRYAAPEQFPDLGVKRDRRFREGPWSDLFSLSVVLYEMVCRVPPHKDGLERFKIMRDTGQDPYIPAAEMIAKQGISEVYSTELLSLIDQGCALVCADRPQSAEDYCARLDASLGPIEWPPIRSKPKKRSKKPLSSDGSESKWQPTGIEKMKRRFGPRSGSIAMILIILILAGASVFLGVVSL